MSTQSGSPIVIIGDGYAAAVLLIHLARRGVNLSSVRVIGDAALETGALETGALETGALAVSALGRGAAYGTQHPHFRLNVRDDLMVIDQDYPNDFVDWAKQLNDPAATDQAGAGQFYRRSDFASYLAEQLAKHNIMNEITSLSAKATHITPNKNNKTSYLWDITLNDGSTVMAGHVILATGNPPPQGQHLIADNVSLDIQHERIIDQPWKGDAVDQIPPYAHVGIIGGGLTALDACFALYENSHHGQITVITPKGLLPPQQSAWKDVDMPPFPDALTASKFIQHMRRYLPDRDWTTPEWQSAFEGMRAQLTDGWQRLPDKDKPRLMRRFGWLWSLIRYRACPQTQRAVHAMRKAGQMQIIADRVNQIKAAMSDAVSPTPPPLMLVMQSHDDLACDHVILAAGVGQDALIKQLKDSHIAGVLANGGINVSDQLQLLAPDGNPQPQLWVLGPPTQFALGDVVGATSTAKQAARLADQLASL